MEGVRVFSPNDWETSGMDGTSFTAEDLKKCLEGLACHLFGKATLGCLLLRHDLLLNYPENL